VVAHDLAERHVRELLGERGEVRVHHLARAARLRRDLNRNLEKAAVVSAGSSRVSFEKRKRRALPQKKKRTRRDRVRSIGAAVAKNRKPRNIHAR
jgi:hypothetical protein